MTEQNSKMIALPVLVGLAAGLTGCCTPPNGVSICPANLDAGLATIVCQPLDQEFTNSQKMVVFEAKAIGDHPVYQWWFDDKELQEGSNYGSVYSGVNSMNLIIQRPTSTNMGFYYCLIRSTDKFGFPLKTRTRLASLGYGGETKELLELLNPPVQPLPVPGSHGSTDLCAVQYCSEVPFRGVGGGGFKASDGTNYINVTNINGTANQLEPPDKYRVSICDVSKPPPYKPVCATLVNKKWAFKAVQGHYYMFVVYFNCDGPPPAKPDWQYVSLNLSSTP